VTEQEQLDTLSNLIYRSQDMCPACKELFDQITWELMNEFEKVIGSKKRKREVTNQPKDLPKSSSEVL
jgi:hypothetical protein